MSKRHFLRTSALALTLAALPIGVLAVSSNLIAFADGNSVGNNQGSSSSGRVVGAEYLRYPSNPYGNGTNTCYTGLRIFLARVDGFETSALDGVFESLADYKKYSLYEISGDGTFFDASRASNPSSDTNLSYYNSSERLLYPIRDGQILGRVGNEISNTGQVSYSGVWSFSSLLGSNNGCKPWLYSPESRYNNTIPTNLGDLANWANEQFNSRLESGSLDLDTFLANYKNALSRSGIATSILPVDSVAFLNDKWSIIVEPVYFAAHFDDAPFVVKNAVALSYQDLFYPLDTTYSYQRQDWTLFDGGGLGTLSRDDGIPKIVNGTIRNFFADFETLDSNGNTINVKTGDTSTGIGDNKYAGLSFYVTTRTLRAVALEIDINRNVSIYSNPLKPAENVSAAGTPIDQIDTCGSSWNGGWGWVTIAKPRTDGQVTTQMQITSNGDAIDRLADTGWWGTNSNKIQYYDGVTTTDGDRRGTLKGLSRDNQVVTTTDKADAYLRLTGTGTHAFMGSADTDEDDYIMIETASAIIKSNTGTARDLSAIDTLKFGASAYKVRAVKSGAFSGDELGQNDNNVVVRTIGDTYSAKLMHDGNDITLTTSGSGSSYSPLEDIARTIESTSSARTYADVQYHGFRVNPNNRDIENIIGNSITSNLANDDTGVRYNMNTGKYQGKPVGTAKQSGIGVSFQFFVPNTKVTTYVQEIIRNEDGTISYGTASSDTYSIYNDGHFVDVDASTDECAVYVLTIPNTSNNEALGVTVASDGASKLADAIFSSNYGYARANGREAFIGVLNADSLWSGVDYNLRSAEGYVGVTSDAVTSVTAGNDTRIYTGACSDMANNEFVGYTVYVIRDSYQTPQQETEMSLEAQRINFVYPTLLGESSGYLLRTADTSQMPSMYHISNNSYYGGTLIGNQRGITGGKYSLLYMNKAIVGGAETDIIFDNEANTSKVFKEISAFPDDGNLPDGSYATANFTVNMTRSAFGDTYVASSLINQGRFDSSYIKDTLGMEIGNKGTNQSGIQSGTTDLYRTGNDYFRWACDRRASILININYGGRDNGLLGSLSYSPWADGEPQNDAGYNISEKVYRYVTVDKGTGSSSSKMLSAGKRSASGYEYRMLSVASFGETLNFYPEVAMMAYKYDDTNPQIVRYSDVIADRLYVMGEKVRTVKPSGLYAINVNNTAGVGINGTTKSDSVAAGSDAEALSDSMGGLQVIYAGGNVNLSASGNFTIDLSGFVLDQIDSSEDATLINGVGTGSYTDVIADGSDIKSDWGNTGYNARGKYEAWVNEVKSSLAVDVGLQVRNGGTIVKEYGGYRASVGQISGGDVQRVESYALTYKNGVVVEDTAYAQLIQAIMNQTGVSQAEAKLAFNQSGINQSILDSIESSNNGQSGSAAGFSGANWYDETVRTFVVRYYKCSPIKLQNVVVSDKIDINAGPSQSGKLFSKGYIGAWNMTVYLNKSNSSMPSLNIYNPKNPNLSADSVLVAKQPISGADFIISDATTSDARR